MDENPLLWGKQLIFIFLPLFHMHLNAMKSGLKGGRGGMMLFEMLIGHPDRPLGFKFDIMEFILG